MATTPFAPPTRTGTWQGGFSVTPLLGGVLIALSIPASCGLFVVARRKRQLLAVRTRAPVQS